MPAKAPLKARALIHRYIEKLEGKSNDPTSQTFLCDRLARFLPAILYKLDETGSPPEDELAQLEWAPDVFRAGLQREVCDYIYDLRDKSEEIYSTD